MDAGQIPRTTSGRGWCRLTASSRRCQFRHRRLRTGARLDGELQHSRDDGDRPAGTRPPGTWAPGPATYRAVLRNNPDATQTPTQLSRKLHELKAEVGSRATDPTWVDPTTGDVHDGRPGIASHERYIGNPWE